MMETSATGKPNLKTSKAPPSSSSGFSLIEIMIVLALIGMFVTFGARRLVNNGRKMKSSVRSFALTVKQLRNRARIENVTYRLVFDLPATKNDPQSYWIEKSSTKEALLMTEDQLEQLRDDLEDSSNGEKIKDPQGFTAVDKNGVKELPRGLFFESIEIAGDDSPQKSGRIYIVFFPQGFVQESAIHLTDRDKLNWTLLIHPLSGKAEIATKYVSLSDTIEE